MVKIVPLLFLRCSTHSLNKISNFPDFIATTLNSSLYLASPEFYHELKKEEKVGSLSNKVRLSLAKYWLRSCTRCTPYGTFAGGQIVTIGESATNIVLNENNNHIRNVRLDMNFMTELIHSLMKIPAIKNQVRFYPNNTIYPASAEWRYVEYSITNNTREYHLSSLERSSYLQTILFLSQNGATLEKLSLLLINKEQVTHDEAEDFIWQMYRSQLLVSELEPAITGREPLENLISQLSKFKGIDKLNKKLRAIQTLIKNPVEGVVYYQTIEKCLQDLCTWLEQAIAQEKITEQEETTSIIIPKNTIQVDLFLSLKEAHINEGLIEAITTQANDLFLLARKHSNSELNQFKNSFYALYEEDEIPLSIALDADLGIGYAGVRDEGSGGGAYVDGLPVVIQVGTGSEQNFDHLQRYSLDKYEEFINNENDCIELNKEELTKFKTLSESLHFSNSMSLMGSVLSKNGKLDNQNFLFDIASFGGPSGGNLLGRFAHGDERLASLVREILKQEEEDNPDAIYAEIVHLPQARVGNILLRPVLRGYEIPYSGKSGADIDCQVPLDDILVSIRGNKIFLRSKKFNKQIIPRLTTAHNFGYKSLPVYKFLCDLQMQGLAWPNVWDWGNLNQLKHLPRVVYKNLILHKATWKIEEKDIKNLPKGRKEQYNFFSDFRSKYKIPEKVVYKEGDNELLIDFSRDIGIELFLHYLKRYKNILLEEFLFTEENCIVTDTNGLPYTNEVIIPLSYKKDTSDKKQHKKDTLPLAEHNSDNDRFFPLLDKTNLQRKFGICSEWLYFKVYAGAKSAENILSKIILPFIEEGKAQKLFEKFFFIRYRDESGGHFRIRFYNTNIDRQLSLQSEFMKRLQPLIDNGTVHNVILDSYDRELERYFPSLMEEAESLFYNDSFLVLRLLNLFSQIESPEEYRMLFALRGIDILLNDSGCSLTEKSSLLKSISTGFFQEFGGLPDLKKQLNNRYRKYKNSIESHMDAAKDDENGIDEVIKLFEVRSEMNAPVIKNIIEKSGQGHKEILAQLLPSYLHMYMNRLFIAQQRKYELVVYTFLERYYASCIAIAKQKSIESLAIS